MRIPYPALFLFLLKLSVSHAQTVHFPVTAACAQAGTYSRQADVFSFQANQAVLASIDKFSAGILSERRFMLQSLSYFGAAVAMPSSSGNFGLITRFFGNTNYNEMEAGLAYGKKLGKKVAAGVQFNYYQTQITGYGRTFAVNFEAGMLFRFTDQVQGGLHVYNPASVKTGKGGESLPAAYSMGFGYDASEHFFITANLEKVENQPVNVQAGFQYRFDDKLLAKAGVSTGTTQYYFGAGVLLKDFRLDAVAAVHPQLGITPGIMLLFKGHKKNNAS